MVWEITLPAPRVIFLVAPQTPDRPQEVCIPVTWSDPLEFDSTKITHSPNHIKDRLDTFRMYYKEFKLCSKGTNGPVREELIDMKRDTVMIELDYSQVDPGIVNSSSIPPFVSQLNWTGVTNFAVSVGSSWRWARNAAREQRHCFDIASTALAHPDIETLTIVIGKHTYKFRGDMAVYRLVEINDDLSEMKAIAIPGNNLPHTWEGGLRFNTVDDGLKIQEIIRAADRYREQFRKTLHNPIFSRLKNNRKLKVRVAMTAWFLGTAVQPPRPADVELRQRKPEFWGVSFFTLGYSPPEEGSVRITPKRERNYLAISTLKCLARANSNVTIQNRLRLEEMDRVFEQENPEEHAQQAGEDEMIWEPET